MKGQIVADFIVDHMIVEVIHNYLELKPWKSYFERSRHKNETRIGIIIISPKDIPTKFKFMIEGSYFNNESQYKAFIADLEILLNLGAYRVEIKGDSKLVVK